MFLFLALLLILFLADRYQEEEIATFVCLSVAVASLSLIFWRRSLALSVKM